MKSNNDHDLDVHSPSEYWKGSLELENRYSARTKVEPNQVTKRLMLTQTNRGNMLIIESN